MNKLLVFGLLGGSALAIGLIAANANAEYECVWDAETIDIWAEQNNVSVIMLKDDNTYDRWLGKTSNASAGLLVWSPNKTSFKVAEDDDWGGGPFPWDTQPTDRTASISYCKYVKRLLGRAGSV